MDSTLKDLAENMADAAAAVVRKRFRKPTPVEYKADLTPVTAADREAEDAMREILSREVPSHGILGEEFGTERTESEYLWVLDPIDGTRQFMWGQPTFGTLIALLHDGRPILGVLDQPILSERWVGLESETTQMNGTPVTTRRCASLGEAICLTPSQNMEEHSAGDVLEAIRGQVKFNRTGLECYGFGLLALGFIDLIVDSWMEVYDFCALIPIVTGAGGQMTDWDGGPMTLDSRQAVAAGDPRVHEAMLRVIGDCRRAQGKER